MGIDRPLSHSKRLFCALRSLILPEKQLVHLNGIGSRSMANLKVPHLKGHEGMITLFLTKYTIPSCTRGSLNCQVNADMYIEVVDHVVSFFFQVT